MVRGPSVMRDAVLGSYPGLSTPVFVACSDNMGEGLVKLIACTDVPGCWVDMRRSGTFPDKLQVSECTTNHNHGPLSG